jgi:acyl-CoA synthetase (AMP-forming)/AMP-acid ligase II
MMQTAESSPALGSTAPNAGGTTVTSGHFWPMGGSADRIAITDVTGSLSYGELTARAARRSQEWGQRQLVMLRLGSDIESVVSYLAVLFGGHVAIVVGPGQENLTHRVQAVYAPSLVAGPDGWERTGAATPEMHPDLQLLMSTSGSTGSPKLVRLSKRNLTANTQDIVAMLGLASTDRTITTLPVSYCYGLSVLNSHLAVGATVYLSSMSVADHCFWADFDKVKPTTIAAVPYTLQLLESIDWQARDTSSLRLVTVAGGAVPDADQTRWREYSSSASFDFVTMYGQTEATARMAVLKPEDYRPGRTGMVTPSGHFRLDQTADSRPGVGEVIYSGPNVMMGYASICGDLARSAEHDELRTGDLGRLIDGYLEICGRRRDFLKVCGLRVDIATARDGLASLGWSTAISAVGDRLGVLIEGANVGAQLGQAITEHTGLPPAATVVRICERLPRTRNGKIDFAAVEGLLREADPDPDPDPKDSRAARQDSQSADVDPAADRAAVTGLVQETYRDVLALSRPPETFASFISLRGDSLSYVATSTRLQQAGVALPTGWQHLTIAELVANSARTATTQPHGWRRFLTPVENTVALRAIAIVLVVGSHIDIFELVGGAHLLLVIAGLNLATFQLAQPERRLFLSNVGRSVGRLLLPIMLWLVPVWLIATEYGASVLLVNNLVGPPGDSPEWRYWFLEAVLLFIVLTALIIGTPRVWSIWQSRPALVGSGLFIASLGWLLLTDRPAAGPGELFTPAVTAWMFALGLTLAAIRDKHPAVKWTLAAVVAGVSIVYFGASVRLPVFLIGVGVLMWVPRIQLPRFLTPVVAAVATASLGIYLTHFQVYPLFGQWGWIGLAASIIAGIAYWAVINRLSGFISESPWLTRVRQARVAGGVRTNEPRTSPDSIRRRPSFASSRSSSS